MLDNCFIPLSLYVHIPWCIQKCPYCDFNSHAARDVLPEKQYVENLCRELQQKLPEIEKRPIQSIFFGGGTPSLFSAQSYATFFEFIHRHLKQMPHAEITLEANPGTVEQHRFRDYFDIGINRLSMGIQSLQNEKLKILGRVHDQQQACRAIDAARAAGFENFNVDLMFGLPQQSVADALSDLHHILQFNPPHLSWYQLTLEPNTLFHKFPPPLPDDDDRWQMQQEGIALLSAHGLQQYEVSAYSQANHEAYHNTNYWLFGDYLGLGAGAHSKITRHHKITRHSNIKHPKLYLQNENKIAEKKIIPQDELPLEFMMNALRLYRPIKKTLFTAHTGLAFDVIAAPIKSAVELDFMILQNDHFELTTHGRHFLNDVLQLFLCNSATPSHDSEKK